MLVSADGCVGVYIEVFVHNTVFLSALAHILERAVLQRCVCGGGSRLQFLFLSFVIKSSHLARPSDCDKCLSYQLHKGHVYNGPPLQITPRETY